MDAGEVPCLALDHRDGSGRTSTLHCFPLPCIIRTVRFLKAFSTCGGSCPVPSGVRREVWVSAAEEGAASSPGAQALKGAAGCSAPGLPGPAAHLAAANELLIQFSR